MSVREAQLQISSTEFTEWMAFYELEPFGDIIADLRHGTAAALLANINRDSKSRPEQYTAEDFIFWRREDHAQEDAAPVLLADPVAQSNLLRAALFGLPPASGRD